MTRRTNKKIEAMIQRTNKKIEAMKRRARRMVIKAKKGQMKSEDDLVIQSLKFERIFDPFAVLWYWLFVICSLGPLIIMSIFVGGAWHKSYTQNVINREKLSKILIKRANPKELVSKIATISISN